MRLNNKIQKVLLFASVCLLFLSCKNTAATIYKGERKASSVETIIIVRHAEKEITGGNDPALSAAGKLRAKKLASIFPGVLPDSFYATNYIRTISTLFPWATTVHKNIIVYDAARLPEFAEVLKKQKGKTIVVAGHTNTVPPLVNLLLGTQKFEQLKDDEYDKIFIVTIVNGIAKVEVKIY